jgi:hypothetical protein
MHSLAGQFIFAWRQTPSLICFPTKHAAQVFAYEFGNPCGAALPE